MCGLMVIQNPRQKSVSVFVWRGGGCVWELYEFLMLFLSSHTKRRNLTILSGQEFSLLIEFLFVLYKC